MTRTATCTCGHDKTTHSMTTEHSTHTVAGQCSAGWQPIGPYLVQKPESCQCHGFRPRPWWWRWTRRGADQ